MDIRGYVALHLGGTPSQETGTSPPSCLLLENRLYILGQISSLGHLYVSIKAGQDEPGDKEQGRGFDNPQKLLCRQQKPIMFIVHNVNI